MNLIKYFFIFLLFYSCNTNYGLHEKSLTNKIVAIKFMHSVNDYSKPIDEKSFWHYKEEHALLIINNENSFIDDIKRLKNNQLNKYYEPNYAILVNLKGKADTIYSDYSLKNWILKEDGKTKYYFDENGEIGEELRVRYSFFNECW